MPITASKIDRSRSVKEAALRTRPYHSSGSRSSMAAAATVCWARTSNGLIGIVNGSISPARILSIQAAVPMICSRVIG